MDPKPVTHTEDIAGFRARMEEFKRTTSDPHWRDINPAQLLPEDALVWRRVQEDAIGADELRALANGVMAGKGQAIDTDTRSNFYAYLINVLASRLAEVELARLRADRQP